MVYKTYADKIILVDDEDKALAEVDFPPINAYAVNITHTFVDDSMRGQGIAGKLMDKLVAHLRRKNLKAVPTCSYAVTWFEKHPEAADVLWSQGMQGGARRKEPRDDAENGGGKQGGQSNETRVVYKTKVKKVKVKADGGKLPDKALKTLSQLMQLASAACMAVTAVMLAAACWENRDMLGDVTLVAAERNYPLAAFLGIMGTAFLFCAVETVWILTRHRYAQNDKLVSLDTGRGITGFVLAIAAEVAAAYLAANPLARPEQIADGIALAAQAITQISGLGLKLAAVGFVLSVIRRVMGR